MSNTDQDLAEELHLQRVELEELLKETLLQAQYMHEPKDIKYLESLDFPEDVNIWDDFKPEIQHRLSDILTRQEEFHKVEVEYWEEQLDDDQNKTRMELEEDIKKTEEHLRKIKLKLKNMKPKDSPVIYGVEDMEMPLYKLAEKLFNEWEQIKDNKDMEWTNTTKGRSRAIWLRWCSHKYTYNGGNRFTAESILSTYHKAKVEGKFDPNIME